MKAENAILDGEVVALDENGSPSFQLLQNHVGFRRSAALRGEKPQTLIFYAFDLLYMNGFDLRRAALIDRRRLLSSIILPGEIIRYSEHFAGRGRELLEAAREKGLEGIIAKQAQSRYDIQTQLQTGSSSKSRPSRTSSSADTFLANVNPSVHLCWVITKEGNWFMRETSARALTSRH